jgi:hypothetical protein
MNDPVLTRCGNYWKMIDAKSRDYSSLSPGNGCISVILLKYGLSGHRMYASVA